MSVICRIVAAFVLVAMTGVPVGAQAVMVFTQGSSLKVSTAEGDLILDLTPRVWGPNWKWVGLSGKFTAADGVATGEFIGKNVAGDKTVYYRPVVKVVDRRTIRFEVAVDSEQDVSLTAAQVAAVTGPGMHGSGRATMSDASGSTTIDVPFDRRQLASQELQKLEIRDAQDRSFVLTFDPPANVWGEKEARIHVAGDRLEAGVPQTVAMTLALPDDGLVFFSPDDVPMPENWDQWFTWNATSDTTEPSAIDMSAWLDAPAGRHGRVTRQNDQLVYNGKPMKFWGLNVCYDSILPKRDIAERKAAFYAKYGINAVRFHKFADGPGGSSILTNTSAVQFDAQKLDNMDYLVSQLKNRGIFIKLSANFGRVPVGPDDFSRIPYIEEFKKLGRSEWRETPQGAMWFADEVGQLQIEQLTNLLNHTNPHTGLRYADDPAIMVVELINENSAYFFALGAMKISPTVKQRAGEAFFKWLKDRYKTEAALLEAWGPKTLNSFGQEKMTGEGWDKGVIYPVGAPWYFDPMQLEGALKGRKQRMLDTIAFFYDTQNAFYDRFVKAIRDTGYEGEILASNWMAGKAYSHYLNLHSDARIGIIDRHNYYGGTKSMLAIPGSGVLSAGMQQVADRPFMLSEWIHTFPSEFLVEGPALVGAYGMGLNGWDVSYMFQNRDVGLFRDKLGATWDVVVPQVIGVFPAVSRQVLRGDVAESSTVFSRNVHVPSLAKGELGFDDQVSYDYDVKQFDSKTIPATSLAIGRSVVTFTDTPTPTPAADLSPYQQDTMIRSVTGELAWQPGKTQRDGFVTINTPGTQAVLGFAKDKVIDLRDITLTPRNWFSAVYVSAIDRDGTIDSDARLLITTMARVRNTDMKMVAGSLITPGGAPMRVEPVTVDLVLKRPGTPVLHVLDHDGRRTGKTLPIVDGKVTLDGAQTQAVYYELAYGDAAATAR